MLQERFLMYYAGIGSRITPVDVCGKLIKVASLLEKKGYILRSGGAYGADQAFEKGIRNEDHKIIWKADDCTKFAKEYAKKYHPAWKNCSDYAKKLLGRNAMIILGEDLTTPVEFVICWTESETHGGTALGVRIAREHKIPIYNVAQDGLDKLYEDVLAY